MPSVRTGPVRLSGYAIKLRRVINASLNEVFRERADLPKKEIQKKVNELLTNFNRTVYQILVEKYMAPKEAVVNIEVTYEIQDTSFVLKDVKVELYELNPTISAMATDEVKKSLGMQA